MSVVYVDTSALIRAYFVDEVDHAELRRRLLTGTEPVVTSEITRVEFASAVSAAARDHRLGDPQVLLERLDADCGDDGPVTLLRLDPATVLPLVYRLVTRHRVRTLDAVHLAVALADVPELAGGEPVVFLTRDRGQAVVAAELGLPVA